MWTRFGFSIRPDDENYCSITVLDSARLGKPRPLHKGNKSSAGRALRKNS